MTDVTETRGKPQGRNPFRTRTVAIVVGVVAVSLAAAAGLTLFDEDLDSTKSAGADTFSLSAIGHRGLVDLLTKLDIPVVVSRADSAAKAANGVLVIAEPTLTDDASRRRFEALVAGSRRVLIVLPKWYGQVEQGRVWVDEVQLIPANEVQPVLDSLEISGSLERLQQPLRPGAWIADDTLELGHQPLIREPQLVHSDGLADGLIAPDGSTLLGRLVTGQDTIHWLLTDPDILSNFGLRTPENAAVTIALLEDLRAGGPVVIDETLHGYARQPSLVRTMFQFPLVIGTLQVLACALLAVWAAMVRFGPRKWAPPPIAPGKDYLIKNTAALLVYCGHHQGSLRRYLQLAVTDVRHRLHAPSLVPTAMTAWLEGVRQRRGGTVSLLELETAVDTADSPERMVEVADRVYRWRKEMIDGSDSRT